MGIFDRIGSRGAHFSDDRIVSIIEHASPLAAAVVDCPLTLPPCVSCERPVCPGVVACDDVSVAYMLALNAKRKIAGARKKRPINPQSQRLWDVERQPHTLYEPSYSANLAPLVVRARTLQKRLNSECPGLILSETSVAQSLLVYALRLGRSESDVRDYRSFERGGDTRRSIFAAMLNQRWIEATDDAPLELIGSSVDVFHAFISALVGTWAIQGQTVPRPPDFPVAEGWLDIPSA